MINAETPTRSSDIKLAPLPRPTNVQIARNRHDLANYYAGRSARLFALAARMVRLGDIESATGTYEDARWSREHAAELRADAGQYLRAERARIKAAGL